VFFLDPDGPKLEAMKYGERQARATHRLSSRQGEGRIASPV
jgi:hypothetical protein